MSRKTRAKSTPSTAPRDVMVTAAKPPASTETTQYSAGMTEQQDFQRVYKIYTELKTGGEEYKPLWDRIAQITGITCEPDYLWNNNTAKKSQPLDEEVNDPTSALAVNQAGDYLVGVMWGEGQGVVKLKPSRYVLDIADEAEVKEWYQYASGQTNYHMNHPDAGYVQSLQPYAYDQFAFGTSGIGIFKNQGFLRGIDENCIQARHYGVDNTRIKDGKAYSADYGFAIYHWSVSQIVSEFCMANGTVDDKSIETMPDAIKNAWKQKNLTTEFDLVFLWMPREDFDPRLMGKRGTRWRGCWFMDSGNSNNRIFCDEDFRDRPINMARMIKVRGEDYGRSSGTLLLSTISQTNYIFEITLEILEKMADPSLGMFGNAIMGDNVLDTSSKGLTIFNQTFMDGKNPPVFPIHDVGDPKGIITFLMPYLNDKVATGFKVDALLDFSSEKDMSATESLQRYNIRGKSLAGMLLRQKNERLIPDVRRSVSICWECGELGVNKDKHPDRARALAGANRGKQLIPDAVLTVFASGKPWYEIEFNNELERLIKTQAIQQLVQMIQSITAIAALYPDIVHAIDWYQMLKDINDNLDISAKIMISAKAFEKVIADAAAARAQMMKAQMTEQLAGAAKDGANANQLQASAGAIRNGKQG